MNDLALGIPSRAGSYTAHPVEPSSFILNQTPDGRVFKSDRWLNTLSSGGGISRRAPPALHCCKGSEVPGSHWE